MMRHNFEKVFKRSLLACLCSAILFISIIVISPNSDLENNYSNLQQTVATNTATTTENEQKVVYLTFDDGPSKVTSQVLDTLKQKNVKATFFVIAAENNEEYLPLITRIINEGHEIGVHSKTHSYSEIYQSSESFWQDIAMLEENLAKYGCHDINLLRFPGGSTNTVSHRYGGSDIMNTLKQQAVEKGYKYFDWNIDTKDAVSDHSSAETIYNRVIDQASGKNTCVVLMHDTKETTTTAQALPDIIDWFLQQGFVFDTLNNKPAS